MPTKTSKPQPRVQRLYDMIPAVDCKRRCQSACGVIPMSDVELRTIVAHIGYEPDFFSADLRCPMLGEFGECTIYELRPAVCRLWGAVKELPCPHGCGTDTEISDDTARSILRSLSRMRSKRDSSL